MTDEQAQEAMAKMDENGSAGATAGAGDGAAISFEEFFNWYAESKSAAAGLFGTLDSPPGAKCSTNFASFLLNFRSYCG